jgi:hypothetical protein
MMRAAASIAAIAVVCKARFAKRKQASNRGHKSRIEHIRWRLWHGQTARALRLIQRTLATVKPKAERRTAVARSAAKLMNVFRRRRRTPLRIPILTLSEGQIPQ